ncbi:PA domain-containing protein [Ditylenchus destructor]|uniref:PA domain-containing protein n=1 Tax=Ditylenchus destructor TaxID=166010 RepID=A0AAD4MJ66_9BILA|nr:PA domain-containing protein [Ditylenchus destructor]
MYKLIAALGILVSIAVFLGYISHVYHSNHKGESSPSGRAATRDEITAKLIENVDPAKILLNLRALTRAPHVAGTTENNRVADVIAHLWKKNGLQDVHFVKYNVLLSYPNYTSPNHVTLLDSTGNVIYQTTGVSPAIFPEEQGDEGAGTQWVAYSANGTAEGDVVYCHYGRQSDFERLRQMGVSVQGKIALLRYHTEFRGSKVRNAVLNGAIGAILYSDPAECAKEGTDQGGL